MEIGGTIHFPASEKKLINNDSLGKSVYLVVPVERLTNGNVAASTLLFLASRLSPL
mgnify:CR=1 FL=1